MLKSQADARVHGWISDSAWISDNTPCPSVVESYGACSRRRSKTSRCSPFSCHKLAWCALSQQDVGSDDCAKHKLLLGAFKSKF
eukprot:1610917-Amphidinium_carterae.1